MRLSDGSSVSGVGACAALLVALDSGPWGGGGRLVGVCEDSPWAPGLFRARAFSFIPSIYFHLRDPTGAIGDVVRGPSRQLECCYSEVYLARVGRGVVFE